jgi:hypothetical protein
VLLLIRPVRHSGEEEPPDGDGQNDDDEGETVGPKAGLPASAGPPDVAHAPGQLRRARWRPATRQRLRKRVD